MGGKDFSGNKQHGHVPVMAAGVHNTFYSRTGYPLPGKVHCAFLYGQGVYIGAEKDRPARSLSRDDRKNTGVRNMAALDSVRPQCILYISHCFRFHERKLGVFVEMTAQGDEFGRM